MPRTLSSPAYKKLQELLTSARNEAGFTQADLAAQLDRPQSFVSKYENGERSLDVIEFVAVCSALGQPPGPLLELIGGSMRAPLKSRRGKAA